MSSPVIPPPLEALRNRPFSFYPAILNIEHNKWQYRKATWSDVLVVNARTGQEIWIPRRFLGEISRIEDPVVIVGLLRELEYKEGAVWPYQRRVIEMPIAVGALASPPVPAPRTGPAPVVGIRLESSPESHILRIVGGALVLGIVAAYVAVNFYRDSVLRPRTVYMAKDRIYLSLTAHDDYDAVIHKLGAPARDRWLNSPEGARYRALWYPNRACTVILMAAESKAPTYIGMLDSNWTPVRSARLPNGDTGALLRSVRASDPLSFNIHWAYSRTVTNRTGIASSVARMSIAWPRAYPSERAAKASSRALRADALPARRTDSNTYSTVNGAPPSSSKMRTTSRGAIASGPPNANVALRAAGVSSDWTAKSATLGNEIQLIGFSPVP